MSLFKNSKRKNHKLKILIIATVTLIVCLTFFLQNISSQFYSRMQSQRQSELERLVDIAYNSISPYIQMVERRQMNKKMATMHIRDILRRLSYSDEFGMNYIFMSSYDGTMLVQPFEPEKEGSNQWDLQDANGKYIIRCLAEAAKEKPEGTFMTYVYYLPGTDQPEEKLSYVRGLPSIEAYIGTGMYLESGYADLNKLLSWQRYGLIISSSILFLLMVLYIWELIEEVKLRKKAESSLLQEKERLSVTMQSIGDGVIATDNNSNVVITNKVAEDLTGWSKEDAVGKPLSEVFYIISEETNEICENPVKKVLETGNIIGLANHTALISKDGSQRSIADSAAPIKDKNGDILGVVLVFRDVTEEKKKEDEILRLSYQDVLTGLHNRRFVEETIIKLTAKDYLPITVIVGDVNGLKMTNDIFGHEAGDNLLKSLAQILLESCRKKDIIARWGGDEFIVLMPNTNITEAEKVCDTIKRKCEASHEGPMQVSISLGYAMKKNDDKSIWEIQKEAEDWMYRNKLLKSKSFRNTVIASLMTTLIEKSMETEEHAERLKLMNIKVGQALGLSSLQLDELELLAMLHDIGKIAVKESILSKPGKLTPSEWEEMKKHCEIGYRITQATPELSKISEYILSHHEWWNGKGYPQGLKGHNIPLLSRILSIADAYDAMTNDRVYQKAISKEDAIAELKRCAGTQFDPKLVGILIDIINTTH